MSGRTGAAYAANLGTMQVSDEISALETLGIPPMEFLVLPRIVALSFVTACVPQQTTTKGRLDPEPAQDFPIAALVLAIGQFVLA